MIEYKINYGVCIADLPVGSKLHIILASGRPLFDQVIIQNYGASIVIKDEYQIGIVHYHIFTPCLSSCMPYLVPIKRKRGRKKK